MEWEEREPYSKRIGDYIALFIRRRLLLILPAIAVSAGAVAVAILLPPVYRSTATVLIEEPEIPRDLVQSTVTGYATQRLQTIQQRVMSTENLRKMIEQYNLFIAERKTKPLAAVIEQFRSNLSLEMVTARIGRRTSATIAFKVGYESSSPTVAQKVTNELVSLYLSENLRGRQVAVKETVNFLAGEATALAQRIDEYEAKLSRFKLENKGRLPGQQGMTMQLISRLQNELLQLDLQIENNKNTRTILQFQLSQVSEYAKSNFIRAQILSRQEKDRLDALRSELVRMRTVFTPRHPDIIRLEMQVKALEQAAKETEKQDAELQAAHVDLARLENSLGQDHPDVKHARQKLESLKSKSNPSITSANSKTDPSQIRNPVFVQLTGQLAKIQTDLKSLEEKKESLLDQLKVYEQRILEIPEVERRYLSLVRDYESTKKRYNDIKNKQISAELAQSLESERKAERFTLIEPPQLPGKPIKPQKILIILGGILGGLVTGAGLVLLRDAFDSAVYGPRHLTAIIGEAPLISIPIVRSRSDSLKRVAILIFWSIFVFGVIFGTAVAAHVYWKPLDVLWYSAVSKYGF